VDDEKSRFLFTAAGNEAYFSWHGPPPLDAPFPNWGWTVGGAYRIMCGEVLQPYTHLPISVVVAKALIHKHFKPKAKNEPLDTYKEAINHPGESIDGGFKGNQ